MDYSSSLTATTTAEKSFHYSYLKEFRVEQCQLFLQHKCTQHRPFTCFNWHFMNQRRRRPVKLKEGNFNYSPDVYCSVYDETTGICPNGDECPYLHRNAGDTERRYHLRYYKTSTCVYETDVRGFCVKNGPHCAFAHGPGDLRQPVYDRRELQGEDDDRVSLLTTLERDKGVLVDDPRWQDHSFVLTYYKTDSCKRPPRLCRQGYACPFYHNNKDRRRSPKHYKYRSTPCPHVKINDEWGDPVHCDSGDSCSYCHSRTEQQFHPEIYKSTKCNDIQQTGYCPRGPFCAFAHGDSEVTAPRELTDEPMVSNPSPVASMSSTGSTGAELDVLGTSPGKGIRSVPLHVDKSQYVGYFQKAPGAEFHSRSPEIEDSAPVNIRKQFVVIDSDYTLDEAEKQRRKQSVLRLSLGPAGSPHVTQQASSLPSSVSDTLEAMVGPSLEDLTLDDISASTHLDTADTPEAEAPSGRMFGSSPVAHGLLHSFSPRSTPSHTMPFSTPLGPLSPYSVSSTTIAVSAAPHLASSHPGFSHPIPAPGGIGSHLFNVHSHSPTGSQPQPQPQRIAFRKYSHSGIGSPDVEVQALKDELAYTKAKVSSWEQSLKQVRSACEAWKREAEECKARAQTAEQAHSAILAEKQQMEEQLQELHSHSSCQQHLQVLADSAELSKFSLSKLENLAQHIKKDMERVEQALRHRLSTMCVQCKQFTRSVAFQPCGHCVLCNWCAEKVMATEQPACPHCNALINSCSSIKLPL